MESGPGPISGTSNAALNLRTTMNGTCVPAERESAYGACCGEPSRSPLNRALKKNFISNLRQACQSPKTDSADLPTERH